MKKLLFSALLVAAYSSFAQYPGRPPTVITSPGGTDSNAVWTISVNAANSVGGATNGIPKLSGTGTNTVLYNASIVSLSSNIPGSITGNAATASYVTQSPLTNAVNSATGSITTLIIGQLVDTNGNPYSVSARVNSDSWPLAANEWSVVDNSINFDNLTTFKTKVESNLPVRIMVIGDSLATQASSLCGTAWGVVETLEKRLGGLNGAYHRAGNYTSTNGSVEIYQAGFTNGSLTTSGYYYDTTNYYGLVVPLKTGDFIEYYDAFWRAGCIPADQIGIAWIAQPGGSVMSVSNKTASGSYAKLGDIDGNAASAVYRWTNYSVSRDSYKVKVVVTATGTNKVIGVTTKDTTATNGVSVMVMENPGANWGNISNCYESVRSSITNFAPDLVMFNMTDSDWSTNGFLSGITNIGKNLLTNAPTAGVLMFGTHWRSPTYNTVEDNKVMRLGCASNGWAFFDAAHYAGSYDHQTNISGFMADTVHLAGTGSLMLAHRFFAKLGVVWPTLTAVSGVVTNYKYFGLDGSRVAAGAFPTYTSLAGINGIGWNMYGLRLGSAYASTMNTVSGLTFGGATNFQFRLLILTTNATYVDYLSAYIDAFKIGPTTDLAANRQTTSLIINVAQTLGGSTNCVSYTPWSTTRSLAGVTTNWWGYLAMGAEASVPTNSTWLLGMEVKYW